MEGNVSRNTNSIKNSHWKPIAAEMNKTLVVKDDTFPIVVGRIYTQPPNPHESTRLPISLPANITNGNKTNYNHEIHRNACLNIESFDGIDLMNISLDIISLIFNLFMLSYILKAKTLRQQKCNQFFANLLFVHTLMSYTFFFV